MMVIVMIIVIHSGRKFVCEKLCEEDCVVCVCVCLFLSKIHLVSNFCFAVPCACIAVVTTNNN